MKRWTVWNARWPDRGYLFPK